MEDQKILPDEKDVVEEKQRTKRDASQLVDHYRQMALFNPLLFGETVHVVGAGATGSHFVDTISNIGIRNIVVYDFDKVEPHNLPNQIYAYEQVGKPKVDALREHIERKTGILITAVNQKVEKIPDLSGILVLCTDSMESQKEIFLTSARLNKKVNWVIETRMGLEQGRIYFFDPNNKTHVKAWLDGWYPSAEAEESPCNARAIATTAKAIAALAAHQIVIAKRIEAEGDKPVDRNKPRTQLYNYINFYMDGSIDRTNF